MNFKMSMKHTNTLIKTKKLITYILNINKDKKLVQER